MTTLRDNIILQDGTFNVIFVKRRWPKITELVQKEKNLEEILILVIFMILSYTSRVFLVKSLSKKMGYSALLQVGSS